MPVVEGFDDSGRKKKKVKAQSASKPAAVTPGIGTGGYLNDEMNQFESDRLSGAPVGGGVVALPSGGLSLNLERLAREIAADQKKSAENQKNKKSARKAASNSLHWLLDQLSRTGNATSTALLHEARESDPGQINVGALLRGAREGWNLNERSNFKEVYGELGYTGRGAGTLGFASDLLIDPLNAVPGGLILKGLKGGNDKVRGLKSVDTARDVGAANRAGVASRIENTGPAYSLPVTPNRANPFQLSTDGIKVGNQTSQEVLAEGAAVIAKAKRGKKSKGEQALDTIEANSPTLQAAKAATGATVAAGNLGKISDQLLGKTDVRIEPLREADEAARLRPIVEPVVASSKAGQKNQPGAVPLDEMPDDVKSTIEYEARKRADEWYDKMGRKGGQKMSELRRQAAREKIAGEGPNVSNIKGGGESGLGSKHGVRLDLSVSGHLKAIETDPDYIAALRRGRIAAIKAHNKNLPKSKKQAPVISRVLSAIPAADEIVEAATKADIPEQAVTSPTPVAPMAPEVKAAVATQATYRLTPELEKAVDKKIENMVNQITSGKVGEQKGHTFFSPIKQVNLYNSVRDALVAKMGYKKGKNRDELLRDPEFRQFVRDEYIRAEEIMKIRHGFQPLEWKRGVPGNAGARSQALSDFFAHVPIEDEIAGLGDSKFWTKMMNESELAERLFAGTAIAEAPKVAHAVEEAVDTAVSAVDTLPESAAMDILDEAPNAVKDALGDASPSAQQVAKDNVKAATEGVAKAKGELWAVKYEQRTLRAADNSGSARLGLREAEATDRIIGLGNIGNHSLLKINASAARRGGARLAPGVDKALADASSKARAAGERLTVRFNAGHGFDPFFHTMRRGVANSAAARSQQHMGEISKIFRGMNHNQVRDVLNDVQMGKLDSPQAQEVNKFLNDLFDPKDGWLQQAGVTMQEYQEQLHRLYPTRKNEAGKKQTDWRPQVVEKPVDKLKKAKPDATWHDSWKYWNWTDNPAADLLKIRLAFENATAQRHMYEDLIHNFGIAKSSKSLAAQAKKEGWVEPKRLHPAMEGHLFPPEIAEQINKHEDMFRMRKDSTTEFMKNYDKLLQAWKTGVTIYSPSHHIRNFAGSMWMAYFTDGVRNPIHYRQAMRAVLHEAPELDPAAFGEALTKSADKDVLFKMKNGTPVTAEMFRIMWRDQGGKQAFASADNLDDLTTVKGRIPTFVREKVASPVEDVARMGHAIALMKRSQKSDPVAALEEIIPRVNRAHVDYGNLTDFERQTMRRFIPFYTWQRHVFPVILDSMWRNPQRVMVYPKAQVAISEARGFERDDTNYFPQSHQISPEWMTEGAGVPYAENKRGNVIYGDPSNPIQDAVFKGLLLHPKESIGGMLSPFVRMPIEMFVRNDPVLAPEGRQFFGGIPIKNRAEYVEDNIPLLNQFIRLTRRDPIHGFQQREATEDRPDEQGMNMTALINFLTAGGLQENTARRQEYAEKNEVRK